MYIHAAVKGMKLVCSVLPVSPPSEVLHEMTETGSVALELSLYLAFHCFLRNQPCFTLFEPQFLHL